MRIPLILFFNILLASRFEYQKSHVGPQKMSVPSGQSFYVLAFRGGVVLQTSAAENFNMLVMSA